MPKSAKRGICAVKDHVDRLKYSKATSVIICLVFCGGVGLQQIASRSVVQ